MLKQFLLKISTLSSFRLLFSSSQFSAIKKKFIAGDNIEDAINIAKKLAVNNISSTIDFLGEDVKNKIKAEEARECYIRLLNKIKENNLPTYISIKLSHFGILLDEKFCFENVSKLVDHTKNVNNFVCIDMESYNLFEKTLQLHKILVKKYFAVGIVVQAYLYKAEELVNDAIKNVYSVRLCKGAYKESALVAYQNKRDVDKNFQKLMFLLLKNSRRFYEKFNVNGAQYSGIGIATHDHNLIEASIQYTKDNKIDKKYFEFQMLYGIRENLQRKIISLGYNLRIYIKLGKEWFSYTLRRMAERPANLLLITRSILT